MEDIFHILVDDIELIEEQLQEFSSYNFAEDIAARMKDMGISSSSLATRANVSHVAVGKWVNKGAKPQGKERFKELGMALGMDEKQLNTFLLANCYPRLYMKNPLDAACRFVLSKAAGNENVVKIYNEFANIYNYNTFTLHKEPMDMYTAELSRNIGNINTIENLEAWMRENSKYFRAFNKSYIPHNELIRFILLYIGEQSINDLYITGELPVTVKNLLYPLIAQDEIVVKGLRAKLIVFGLYQNMNEYEIDIMLSITKLQPITEPLEKVDNALLTALRCAHERYPYFELNNAQKALENLEDNEMPELRGFFHEQKLRASELVDYYEKDGIKSEHDLMFEENYTDYADSGILKYIRDIFEVLVTDGLLKKTETAEYVSLMQTYRD
jgi:transcriptional regulator with XRE-family HTH domain